MQTTHLQPFSLYINLVITVLSLYAAWVNLVQKKISTFGFDAWLLVLYSLFDARQVRNARRDPKLIQRLGVFMLLIGIGGVYNVVTRFFELYR